MYTNIIVLCQMDSLIKFSSSLIVFCCLLKWMLFPSVFFSLLYKLNIQKKFETFYSKAWWYTYLIADDQAWPSAILFWWNQWTTTTWWAWTRCQWTFSFTKGTFLTNHLNLWCIDFHFRHFNRWNILYFRINQKKKNTRIIIIINNYDFGFYFDIFFHENKMTKIHKKHKPFYFLFYCK